MGPSEAVDRFSPKVNTASSINLKIISDICTSPLYRKEEWLRQKYLVEKLPARQIAALIGCSHHAVNSALKRFGMKRDITARRRLGFEVRWGPNGRITPARLKAIVRWMTKLRSDDASYHDIAKRLEAKCVEAPSGRVKWYACTVRSILMRNRS